jgi:hypothetical protein
MAESHEDLMDRTLRWMGDNLQGANNAKYPPGHPQEGDHCVNSGTCILVCCYINVLGKVLLKGRRASDFRRFRAFLDHCMHDFLDETSSKMAHLAPKLKSSCAADWIYKEY